MNSFAITCKIGELAK